MKILNRFTGKLIKEVPGDTLVGCDLSHCDLSRSNLFGSDLSHCNLSRSNLFGSDLSRCDLSHCNLSNSDLSGSDLRDSNLSRCNLRGSDLSRCNLRDSNLSRCNLRDSNLSRCNLFGSDLSNSNLSGSDLSFCNLSGSDLSGSDLSRAVLPPPSVMLLARWGEVSNKLCAELMRYDAANHPNPKAFKLWAKGGPCPMVGFCLQRSANFVENKKLYKTGKAKSAFELMMMLFKEKNIKR